MPDMRLIRFRNIYTKFQTQEPSRMANVPGGKISPMVRQGSVLIIEIHLYPP